MIVKCFDSNKTMSFKVIDDKLLKKYTQIWERVRSLAEIKYSESVYGPNDKHIKTKIKLCVNKVKFLKENMCQEKTNHAFLCFLVCHL